MGLGGLIANRLDPDFDARIQSKVSAIMRTKMEGRDAANIDRTELSKEVLSEVYHEMEPSIVDDASGNMKALVKDSIEREITKGMKSNLRKR